MTHAPTTVLPSLPVADPAATTPSSATPAARLPVKVPLFGVDVSVTHYAEVVDCLVARAKRREPTLVAFAPANIIVEAASNAAFRAKVNDFSVVCPDGQPVRWCLNHFHRANLADRVYGPTTTLKLCEAAEREGLSVYFYGASPATIGLLTAKVRGLFPALKIAGAESPPFRPLTDAELVETGDRMNASGADLVFIGTGSVRQETFAWNQRDRVRAVQLCVGAAFDFIAGVKPTAPAFMQRNGLEWLYRLCKEPKRLGRRYFVTNAMFVGYVLREKLRTAVARRPV